MARRSDQSTSCEGAVWVPVQTQENIIVADGYKIIARELGGGSGLPLYVGLGTGNTSSAKSQTELVTEVHRGRVTSRSFAGSTATISYVLPSGTLNGTTIREAGLLDSPSDGLLFNRVVLGTAYAKVAGNTPQFSFCLGYGSVVVGTGGTVKNQQDWDWPYFTFAEFASPDSAGSLISRMDDSFMRKLVAMREHVGHPMVVTSGYRTEHYNNKVGGSPNSFHLLGMAADIWMPPKHVPFKFVDAAIGFGFKGIGLKLHGPDKGRYVHIDTRSGGLAMWTYP